MSDVTQAADEYSPGTVVGPNDAQRAADAQKAKEAAAAKAQHEYDQQPRVRLQRILTGLSAQHTDVRDHLGVLTRAVHALASLLHEAAPGVKPLETEDENGEGH